MKSTVPSEDVRKGRSVQLKWQIDKNSGEKYLAASIKLLQPGKAEITVAHFLSEFDIKIYPDYSKRGWTVKHAQGTLVLNISNAKEFDNGVYNLEMRYATRNGPVSDKLGIRLNVHGKMKTFLHYFFLIASPKIHYTD